MRKFLTMLGLSEMQKIDFERFVFTQADNMLPGYKGNGGVWEAQELGNTIILMLPVPDGEVTLYNYMSGNEIKTDRVTASAAFSVLVVNWFLNLRYEQGRLSDASLAKLTDAYHLLRGNIGNVPDASAFFDFTD